MCFVGLFECFSSWLFGIFENTWMIVINANSDHVAHMTLIFLNCHYILILLYCDWSCLSLCVHINCHCAHICFLIKFVLLRIKRLFCLMWRMYGLDFFNAFVCYPTCFYPHCLLLHGIPLFYFFLVSLPLFFFMLWISVLTSLLLSFFCLQKLASSSSSHASKAVDSSKLSLAQPIAEKVVELLEVKSTTNLATNQTSKMHIQSWSSALSFVILMTTEGEIIWLFSQFIGFLFLD